MLLTSALPLSQLTSLPTEAGAAGAAEMLPRPLRLLMLLPAPPTSTPPPSLSSPVLWLLPAPASEPEAVGAPEMTPLPPLPPALGTAEETVPPVAAPAVQQPAPWSVPFSGAAAAGPVQPGGGPGGRGGRSTRRGGGGGGGGEGERARPPAVPPASPPKQPTAPVLALASVGCRRRTITSSPSVVFSRSASKSFITTGPPCLPLNAMSLTKGKTWTRMSSCGSKACFKQYNLLLLQMRISPL
mmetsp:Transcript_130396/g.417158  ORF Transcript_130396/g.417158 Transcript_130396/m.417158 type:complete len:242 (+) Transcript_130396:662-1387(+)